MKRGVISTSNSIRRKSQWDLLVGCFNKERQTFGVGTKVLPNENFRIWMMKEQEMRRGSCIKILLKDRLCNAYKYWKRRIYCTHYTYNAQKDDTHCNWFTSAVSKETDWSWYEYIEYEQNRDWQTWYKRVGDQNPIVDHIPFQPNQPAMEVDVKTVHSNRSFSTLQ